MRKILSIIVPCALLAAALGVNSAQAAQGGNAYGIGNNTPGFIKHAKDLGPTSQTTQIGVTVWLQLHNQQQLDQLVTQQQQKGSGQYHKWLTQGQFNASYGPTSQEVNSVENYLNAKGLTVTSVADNNWSIDVQGTVAQVERAFNVQIDNYTLNGDTYFSNTGDPSVNDSSGSHVAAITGLDNYDYQPALVRATEPDGTIAQPLSVPRSAIPHGLVFEGQCFSGTETHTFTSSSATATYSGNRYGAAITNTSFGHIAPCGYSPQELQTAYNLNPLYATGLAGQGQTIVIVDAYGSPTIQQDAEAYSQVYGLPDLTSTNFHVIQAPGSLNHPACTPTSNPRSRCNPDWSGEITLDVELAHAMAPGATIDLLVAPNAGTDLEEAINYAVVHHLGNVVSNSWGEPEEYGNGNGARLTRDNRIFEEAAAEGIDVNFSSGDCGDMSPSPTNPQCAGFKTPGWPASSPYVTGIGGTSLALNPDDTIAFQTGWGTNLTRIAGRASENFAPSDPPLNEGFVYGSGGGVSQVFAKPAWQTGVPGTMRMEPDISMLADPYTGAEIINVDPTNPNNLFIGVIGGTSLASPMFSGVMAIATQKAGQGLGQVAPLVYGLQSSSTTSTPIYDVTAYSSPTNVAGSIMDAAGRTTYSADQLAGPLDGVTSYYSAFYNSPFSTRWFDLTFGTDSSLVTGPGWDDATGVGTPNGATFVNAIAP